MGAIGPVGDELGDHRVVVDGDLGALADAAVDAKRGLAVQALGRRPVAVEPAARRQESAGRVLGIEARFDGPAVEAHVRLREAERLAGRHPDHALDEVDAGDKLGDRMLHLQAGVHFEEIEVAAGVDDELHRSGRIVADGVRESDRLGTHRRAQGGIDRRRRRLLDDLLVAPLDRALALAEMDDGAVPVAQHLHLDMARRLDETLDEHAVVAEGGARLRTGRAHAGGDLGVGEGNPHALAAATGRRLDHHRQANIGGDRDRLAIVVDGAEVAGNGGDPGVGGELLRFDLVAHGGNGAGVGTNEGDAGGGQCFGKRGALREKPIARMDGVGTGSAAGLNEIVDHQVRGRGRRRPDGNRLVGHLDVERVAVGVAVDGDGGDPHPPRGADDAAGDLAAVGDQDLGEHMPRRPPAAAFLDVLGRRRKTGNHTGFRPAPASARRRQRPRRARRR